MPKSERAMVLALIRGYKRDGLPAEAAKWQRYYDRLKAKGKPTTIR